MIFEITEERVGPAYLMIDGKDSYVRRPGKNWTKITQQTLWKEMIYLVYRSLLSRVLQIVITATQI